MDRALLRVDGDVDLLALHAANPRRYPYLLESATGTTAHGRFDILFAMPDAEIWLDGDGALHGLATGQRDFLQTLDAHWQAERVPQTDKPVPFLSGWFVYLGYETAQQFEPTLQLHRPTDWPVAFATQIRAAIIRDRQNAIAYIASEQLVDRKKILSDIDELVASDLSVPARLVTSVIEEPPARFVDAVRQAKRHIQAGDIYQANLSREWRASLHGPVADEGLYRRLTQTNPGNFAGLAHWRGNALISSSPERLLCVRDRIVQTRPIAGTRPRGASLTADRALSRELIAHPKERAEHIMLIDLERNDLGRVCEPGSVIVDEFMAMETYAHVHHIVSNVSGRLQEGVSSCDAIRAVFPGGTITGCPKVRCMEIIDRLEDTARGAYTGSMGYLDRDGDCDLNILIRTLVRTGRTLSLRAGAGIVADSIASHEVEETRAKARGILLALGAA